MNKYKLLNELKKIKLCEHCRKPNSNSNELCDKCKKTILLHEKVLNDSTYHRNKWTSGW
jgi:predicted amidophosphoribosyltransferase